MERADFFPVVGAVYDQRGAKLRVVATAIEGCVLLEQWVGGQLNQYIVASQFFLLDGELHWRGNGTYFPCKYPPPVCDTPFAALYKAATYMQEPRKGLREVFPINVEASSSAHEILFGIPNGTRIVAEINGHARGSSDNWSSIDVFARFPNGQTEILCCADFETEEGNRREYNRLRVMAYLPGEDDPHVTLLPLKHRSIWLSLDEGTFDINVWNEDENDRDERMEIGHIPTLDAATRLMRELIEANLQIIWTQRALKEK